MIVIVEDINKVLLSNS